MDTYEREALRDYGETQVVIRSTQQGLSGYYRWYLDNVKMTKIAAE